jgi:transcription elongation factor GreA
MADNVKYLTPEGLENLEERLEYLRTVRRAEIAERLRLAMEEGGEIQENAEYEDAKQEQAFVEGEIIDIENILGHAEIIEDTGNGDKVVLGSYVVIQEAGIKETETYHIVGSAEARPREGRISYESPIGRALLGAKVGDEVVVKAPGGEITFTVKEIE